MAGHLTLILEALQLILAHNDRAAGGAYIQLAKWNHIFITWIKAVTVYGE